MYAPKSAVEVTEEKTEGEATAELKKWKEVGFSLVLDPTKEEEKQACGTSAVALMPSLDDITITTHSGALPAEDVATVSDARQ